MTVERHTALAAIDGLTPLVPLGTVRGRAPGGQGRPKNSTCSAAPARSPAGRSIRRCRTIRAGMTERELAVLIERAMVDAGAERPAFDTIVASGPNGAIPHHSPGRPSASSRAT